VGAARMGRGFALDAHLPQCARLGVLMGSASATPLVAKDGNREPAAGNRRAAACAALLMSGYRLPAIGPRLHRPECRTAIPVQ
jgi:hypothetical protein